MSAAKVFPGLPDCLTRCLHGTVIIVSSGFARIGVTTCNKPVLPYDGAPLQIHSCCHSCVIASPMTSAAAMLTVLSPAVPSSAERVSASSRSCLSSLHDVLAALQAPEGARAVIGS